MVIEGKSKVCKFCFKALGKFGYDLGFCSQKCFGSWMNGETPKVRNNNDQ